VADLAVAAGDEDSRSPYHVVWKAFVPSRGLPAMGDPERVLIPGEILTFRSLAGCRSSGKHPYFRAGAGFTV